MFALSNIAYLRSAGKEKDEGKLPVMLYSALNVRPFLKKETNPVDWYHIAIGYYKCVLELLLVTSEAKKLTLSRPQRNPPLLPPLPRPSRFNVLAPLRHRQVPNKPRSQDPLPRFAGDADGARAGGEVDWLGEGGR